MTFKSDTVSINDNIIFTINKWRLASLEITAVAVGFLVCLNVFVIVEFSNLQFFQNLWTSIHLIILCNMFIRYYFHY